jgi:hypothetical protein
VDIPGESIPILIEKLRLVYTNTESVERVMEEMGALKLWALAFVIDRNAIINIRQQVEYIFAAYIIGVGCNKFFIFFIF